MAEAGQYSHSVLGASEELKDIYCEPCKIEGLVEIAEGYCVDCPEYLCAQCYKSHHRNKGLAKHVLLDKDSMPTAPDSNTSVLDVCEEKCKTHPDEVVKLFCETCNKVGCHICVSTNHGQCKKVKRISEIVSTELEMFKENIQSTEDQLSKYDERIQAKITSNNKMKELAEQELKHQRAEINKILDQLETKMNDKITQIEKRNNDSVKVFSDGMDPMKKEFDQIKNDIEGMSKGRKCGQFIALMRCKEKITNLHNKMNCELSVQCYKLLPSEQIQAMMGTKTELCRMTTASFESKTDKTSSERRPAIQCLTIVQGCYCVAVDKSNNSINVIDTKSKLVTTETNTEAKDIRSITSVSDDKVAASCRNQIQFFTVSSSGVMESTNQQYSVKYSYRDMVHCKGNIYGIGFANRIDVLSMTGEIIRLIQTDDKGTELFRSLQGIAVSPDGQTIYVTDSRKGSVTSLTLDGKVKAIYTDLINPQGITVDKYGYVYVNSGTNTQSLHQLTADLKMFQVLLENQVPTGRYVEDGNNMTYSSTEHKLYINDYDCIHQYSLDC